MAALDKLEEEVDEQLRWALSAETSPADTPGDAIVAVTATNHFVGTLNLNIRASWRPGMEGIDVETWALSFVSVLMTELAASAARAAGMRAVLGER